jgi:hypothetical protein
MTNWLMRRTIRRDPHMPARPSRRPSPAMVLAILALFVAVGGTAYAGVKLGKNAVKTKNIKNSAVTNSKIADGAITSSKIGAGQVAPSSLGSVVTRVVTTDLPDNGTLQRAIASCASGEKLIGGGANIGAVGSDVSIQGSRPSTADGSAPSDGDTFSSWQASAINAAGGTTSSSIRAWAVCLK